VKGRSIAYLGENRTMGVMGSALLHASVVALALGTATARKVEPPVYAVNLVAAPLPTNARRLAREAIPQAAPEPETAPAAKTAPPKPAEKAAPIKPKAETKPAPKRATPAPSDASREKAPKTRSEAQPLPGETPGTGSDVANLKIPGIDFPYPEYLRNIMNQVLRRWSPPGGTLRAEVAFLILKDGTVRDIRFLTRSGNFSFDLEAQGAIESAGNAKAFGELPDGWDANMLPVTFVFEPRQ
jgi:outer membrane biosynthesis protein TonB